MSPNAKTERAAKTKAAKAIKSLAKSSKRRVKQEDDVPVVGAPIKQQEEEVEEEVYSEEDEIDSEVEERAEHAAKVRNNWKTMDNMVICVECFEVTGIYGTECHECHEIMTECRFGECGGGCEGVQFAHRKCYYCEEMAVIPFGG